MANQTGIYISIKAWLPTGKGLDDQFAALSIVKTAHETGDYAPLLSAATIEGVQTEQKTRRMGESVAAVSEAMLSPNPILDEVPYTTAPEDTDILPGPIKGKKVA